MGQIIFNGDIGMKFKSGDSVKVKKGVMCPNDDSVCLENWQSQQQITRQSLKA